MATRVLYRTKLCSLFARGNCPREVCTFAHGEEELRRPPPLGDERHSGYRGGPDRFERSSRRSPDGRRRYDSRRTTPRIRGRSRSISPVRRRSWSRSPLRSPLVSSDGAKQRESKDVKRHRPNPSEPRIDDFPIEGRRKNNRDVHEPPEKLPAPLHDDPQDDVSDLEKEKEALLAEIRKLTDTKTFFEEKLEQTSKGVEQLSARAHDLESRLNGAEQDAQSDLGKVRKIIKANQRLVRAQDDLKRSQSKLHKMAEEMAVEEQREAHSNLLNTTDNRKTAGGTSGFASGGQPLGTADEEIVVEMSHGRDEDVPTKGSGYHVALDLNERPPESGVELNGADHRSSDQVAGIRTHSDFHPEEVEGGKGGRSNALARRDREVREYAPQERNSDGQTHKGNYIDSVPGSGPMEIGEGRSILGERRIHATREKKILPRVEGGDYKEQVKVALDDMHNQLDDDVDIVALQCD